MILENKFLLIIKVIASINSPVRTIASDTVESDNNLRTVPPSTGNSLLDSFLGITQRYYEDSNMPLLNLNNLHEENELDVAGPSNASNNMLPANIALGVNSLENILTSNNDNVVDLQAIINLISNPLLLNVEPQENSIMNANAILKDLADSIDIMYNGFKNIIDGRVAFLRYKLIDIEREMSSNQNLEQNDTLFGMRNTVDMINNELQHLEFLHRSIEDFQNSISNNYKKVISKLENPDIKMEVDTESDIHSRLDNTPKVVKKYRRFFSSHPTVLYISSKLYETYGIGNIFSFDDIKEILCNERNYLEDIEMDNIARVISKFECVYYERSSNIYKFVSEFKSENVVPRVKKLTLYDFLDFLVDYFSVGNEFSIHRIKQSNFFNALHIKDEYFLERITQLIELGYVRQVLTRKTERHLLYVVVKKRQE